MKKRFLILFLLFIVYLSFSAIGAFAISFDIAPVLVLDDKNNEKSYVTSVTATNDYGNANTSYMYRNNDGTISIFDATSGKINIDTYNAGDFSLVSTIQLEFELAKYGGFFSGEKYNYIAFGQDNRDKSDSKEVIRLVKYDKNFKRLDSFSLKNCYTEIPFRSGCLRMDEYKNELTVHTSRQRYDGHQSQLSFTVNTTDMTLLTENVGEFQSNHVSHSFNQFIKYDKGDRIFVDHGDAYPRSVVLINEIHPDNDINYDFKKVAHMFRIPGNTGENYTGVCVGGFEVSKNNYLVSINSVDHSKLPSFTIANYNELREVNHKRDVILLVQPKSGGDTKQVYLTDYTKKGLLASPPYIVKITDKRFVIMWQEFKRDKDTGFERITDNGLKYVCVDENGKAITDIYSQPDFKLSQDCEPLYIDGKIMWYYSDGEKRYIHSIGIVGQPIKEAVYTQIVAKINGYDIASYNVEGYTCVVAEDLRNYGFDVTWNPNDKTLKINRADGKKIASNYVAPVVDAEKTGKKSFDILYTNIKTYIDGKEVTGYNIDGRTVVYFKDLSAYGNVTYDGTQKIAGLQIAGLN